MSENTNNRSPQLIGRSFFFTEPDKVEQSVDQAFGPMEPNPEQKFRLGAKMSIKAPFTFAKVFAICTGNVLIQPQEGNPNKVNLILRPLIQPFNGMPVKFFIYRGLDKAGILEQNGAQYDETKLASSNASPFIQGVRQDYANLNGVNVSDPMESAWIGYNLGNPPYTGLVDDLFFRISPNPSDDDPVNAKNDELPFVSEGVELGRFSDDFQLDIVLGSPDYKQVISSTGFYLDINFIRATEGIIDIANCPVNYPEKAYREAILEFIDPAAFWGMHCSYGDQSQVTFSGGNSNVTNCDEIYSQACSLFQTSNAIYLVVLDQFLRSYSYHQNCSSVIEEHNFDCSLLLSTVSDVPTNSIYNTSNWPLKILDASTLVGEYILKLRLSANSDAATIFCSTNRFINSISHDFLFSSDLLMENDSTDSNIILVSLNIVNVANEKKLTSWRICINTNSILLFAQNSEVPQISVDLNQTVGMYPPLFSIYRGNSQLSEINSTQSCEGIFVSPIRMKSMNKSWAHAVTMNSSFFSKRIDIPNEGFIELVVYYSTIISEGSNAEFVRAIVPQKVLSESSCNFSKRFDLKETLNEKQGLKLSTRITIKSGHVITEFVTSGKTRSFKSPSSIGITSTENDILTDLILSYHLINPRVTVNLLNNEVVLIGEDVEGGLIALFPNLLVYGDGGGFYASAAFSRWFDFNDNSSEII